MALRKNATMEKIEDSVVDSIISKFKQRSETGIKKYGTTLDRNDLTPEQWLNHLEEELMDAILYCHRIRKELNHIQNHNKP